MKREEEKELKRLKLTKETVEELSRSYVETLDAVKGVSEELKSAKKLWKTGQKSRLVKLGLTLIAFPEPSPVTEIVGAMMVSAGLLQRKIKNSGLHIEDVRETFQGVLENLNRVREELI